MKFTIRDLLWLTAVAALVVGFVVQFFQSERAMRRSSRDNFRLSWLLNALDERGYGAEWDDSAQSWKITPPLPPATGVTP